MLGSSACMGESAEGQKQQGTIPYRARLAFSRSYKTFWKRLPCNLACLKACTSKSFFRSPLSHLHNRTTPMAVLFVLLTPSLDFFSNSSFPIGRRAVLLLFLLYLPCFSSVLFFHCPFLFVRRLKPIRSAVFQVGLDVPCVLRHINSRRAPFQCRRWKRYECRWRSAHLGNASVIFFAARTAGVKGSWIVFRPKSSALTKEGWNFSPCSCSGLRIRLWASGLAFLSLLCECHTVTFVCGRCLSPWMSVFRSERLYMSCLFVCLSDPVCAWCFCSFVLILVNSACQYPIHWGLHVFVVFVWTCVSLLCEAYCIKCPPSWKKRSTLYS